MNVLTKKRLLIGTIVALLIMNISALGTIAYNKYQTKKHIEQVRKNRNFNKNRGHGKRNYLKKVKRYVRKELDLTEEQFKEYSRLKDLNMKKTGAIWKEIEAKRKLTYKEFCKENPDTAFLNALSADIGELHKQLHQETIHHFYKVHEILNPEQQKKFNQMLCKMAEYRKLNMKNQKTDKTISNN